MIQILDSIPNSVTSTFLAASIAPPASGPSGLGGFASALAAAQDGPAAPQPAGNAGGSSSTQVRPTLVQPTLVQPRLVQPTLIQPSGGKPADANPPASPSGNPLPKKSPGAVLASLSAAVIPGVVTPVVTPVADTPVMVAEIDASTETGASATIQVQFSNLQTTANPQTSPNPTASFEPAPQPVLSAALKAQTPGTAAGTFQPILQQAGFSSASQNAVGSYSKLSPPLTSQPAASLIPPTTTLNQGVPGQTTPNAASQNQNAPAQSEPGQATTMSGQLSNSRQAANNEANPATENFFTSRADGLSSTELRLPDESERAPNASPPAGSLSSDTASSDSASPTAVQGGQGSTIVANEGISGNARLIVSSNIAAEPAPGVARADANANLEMNATANVGSSVEASVPTSAAAFTGAAPQDYPVQDNAVQADTSAPSAATGALVEGVGSQLPATPILNAAALAASGKAMAQSTAARVSVAATNPGIHGTGAGTEMPAAPNSVLGSAAGTESGNSSAAASQTPFSVFFSSPGPGAEAGVSALPKMILPAGASTIRASHTVAGGAASATPQAAAVQGGIRQNSAAPGPKDVASGNGSTTAPNVAQAFHAESDASAAAGVQSGPAATASAPSPSLPASPAVTVPVSTPSLPASGSLPQTAPAPTTAAPSAPAAAEPAVLGSVQVAQLVNRMGQSEMRIGLNTSAFGSVEVRTTVRTSDVGLVIGSEKGDLHTLLANEMPAIASTLQQQNLRLNSVNFMQGFAFSNNASGGDAQQRSFVPMRGFAGSGSSEGPVEDSPDPQPTGRWSGGSLSILA